MQPGYQLSIQPSICSEKAWQLLESEGVEVLYYEQDDHEQIFYILAKDLEPILLFKWVISYKPWSFPEIDWEAQWKIHGAGFKDGLARVDLSAFIENGPVIQLYPGAGFGDFSHPTTQLATRLIQKYLSHRVLIDLGSGSGILSFAGIAFGAKHVFGIEIDPEALKHSQLNRKLNKMDEKIDFVHPSDLKWKTLDEPVLIIMNMIESEQEIAWRSLSDLHDQKSILLTTGVHKDRRDSYLKNALKHNWKLLKEYENHEWLGFVFSIH